MKVYTDTWDVEKAKAFIGDAYEGIEKEGGFINLSLSFVLSDASAAAQKLGESLKLFNETKFNFLTPIIKSEGNKLVIGLRFPVPLYEKLPKEMLQIPQDVQLLFADIDQYLKVSLDLK